MQIGRCFMVNVMGVVDPKPYGLDQDSLGNQFLVSIIDFVYLVEGRVTVLSKIDLLGECLLSRAFSQAEFEKALKELQVAGWLTVVKDSEVDVVVPTEILISRYNGTRIRTLYRIQ